MRTGSYFMDDVQGDTLVQIPLFHSDGDHESAKEKKDEVVGVIESYGLAGHDAEQGKQNDGKQSCDRQRGSFANPPDRHENGYGDEVFC